MENQDFNENWPVLKERLQKKYPHLTKEELEYEIGKEGELLERLQLKLNQNWKDIKDALSLLG